MKIHKSKGLPYVLNINNILNECFNFRSKSIGEMPKEETSKLRRYEELTQYRYSRHRSREETKPYEHAKPLNALMLPHSG